MGTLTVPGHEWPGYTAAPDKSGSSPIHGGVVRSPAIDRRVEKLVVTQCTNLLWFDLAKLEIQVEETI
jgi:hypothetical protein